MPEKIKKDALYLRLRDDIIETMLAGNQSRNTTQACYPASHSDMGACVDALLRMFEIKRRPIAADLVDEQFYDPATLRADIVGPIHLAGESNYKAGQLPGLIAAEGRMGMAEAIHQAEEHVEELQSSRIASNIRRDMIARGELKVGDPDPIGGGLLGDHGRPNVMGDLRTPMERERDERLHAPSEV